MKKGFTLVESLIAIFIVAVGLVGVFVLISSAAGNMGLVSNKLIASYLAQEGVEIVKNIRDNNFVKIHKTGLGFWSDGLTGCASGCEADYADSALTPIVGGERFLKIELGYNYILGDNSIFKRKIIIAPAGADAFDVAVEVFWQEKTQVRQISVNAKLYKWLQ